MKKLNKANEYLKNKMHKKDEYRPSYHLTPDFGWCNDPHGIIFFNGQYHIFFQYNPYDTKAENIFWGHVTSGDLIHFSITTCALAPDMPYDNSGCFSGSSIVIDDTLYLVYTGFSIHDDGKYYQTINVAYSKDGYRFLKYKNNPIIDTCDFPYFGSINDFRDPCIFKRNDKFYIIVGNKSKDEKEAMLLLYEGDDIFNFHFLKILVSSSKFGTMFECPNLVSFPKHDYIIMSPQNVKERNGDFANIFSCVYFKLKGDFIHDEQTLDEITEIDHGLEYYAPTVYDKEKILVNWFQMWRRRYYLNETDNDFINSFSLFKRIGERNGKLYFKPLTLDKFMTDKNEETFTLNGKTDAYNFSHYVIKFTKEENLLFNFVFFDSEEDFVTFSIDYKSNTYTLDRSNALINLGGDEKGTPKNGIRYLKKNMPTEFEFDIYIDNANIEIYFDNYEESFSFLHFSKENKLFMKSNESVQVSMIRENIEVK